MTTARAARRAHAGVTTRPGRRRAGPAGWAHTVVAARAAPRRVASAGSARRSSAAGQASVEVALLLPLLALVAVGLVQVGLVARDQIMLAHSAREAARTVAVTGEADRARPAALAAARLEAARLRVRVSTTADQVTVRLDYRSPLRLFAGGSGSLDVGLSTSATMRAER